MLIKQIFIENGKEASDIRVSNGVFEAIAPALEPLPGEEVIDGTGKSAFPPFIESHVHLDTCLTAGDPVWNMSGTLFEGIECWSKRKEKLSRQDVKERARRAVQMQAANGVQYVRTHVDVTDPSLTAMELAERYDRRVDVHCDEIDDEQSRGLEVLACRALESGLKDRVTASHTTAMHSYNNAYCSKLFRLLKMSDINFVSNPLVNTHLQGRFDSYPRRRGVTRVKELLANGNNVSMGHDDIFDPWYPLGDGNMMSVVHMGLHVCQMMGYEEILNSYRLITHNAARTLNLGDTYGIKVGNPADFIVLNQTDFYQALNKQSEVLLSYREGRLIASTKPAEKSVLF